MNPTTTPYDVRSPGGRAIRFHVREGTSDVSVIHSTSIHDEYAMKALDLSGWALDLGAHIGSVCIPLATDNPGLQVIAVEALPENAEMLARNIEENGLGDRIHVVPLALSDTERDIQLQRLPSDADRFIANAFTARGRTDMIRSTVQATTLTNILADVDEVVWAKFDCEGCEWRIFGDDAIVKLAYITGEWHGDTSKALVAALSETHDVTITADDGGIGHFTAVRRPKTYLCGCAPGEELHA